MSKVSIFIFVLITCFTVAKAQSGNMKGLFQLVVEATPQDLNYVKNRAELSMARDTRYCRGALMPKSSRAGWRCQNLENGKQKCELDYQCARIHTGFSRLTETKRLIAIGKDHSQNQKNFVVSSKPAPPRSESKRAPLPKSQPKTTQKYPEIPIVKPLLTDKAKPRSQAPVVESSNLIMKSSVNQRETLDEESLDLVDLMENTDRTEKKKEEFFEEQLSALRLGRFSLAFSQISNNLDGSLATLNFAWIPRYKFKETGWAIRGQVGGHLYEANFGLEPEQFLVIEMMAFAEATVGESFFLELGAGLQRWNVDGGENFTTLGLGGGWQPKKAWLGFINRVGLHYHGVSTEDEIKELRVSVGIGF